MKKLFGFSRVELTAVGIIVGALISLAVLNFRSSAQKARDVQRKSDVKAIQEGLERFRNNQKVPSYPLSESWANALKSGGFMQEVPRESKPGWSAYSYMRDAGGLKYSLTACLENMGDVNRDRVNVCNQGYSYTLTEKEK